MELSTSEPACLPCSRVGNLTTAASSNPGSAQSVQTPPLRTQLTRQYRHGPVSRNVSVGTIGPGGLCPSGAISAPVHPFLYTLSADNAKLSVAGFRGEIFQSPIGRIPVILLPKIGRYRSIKGGKAGPGHGLGRGPGKGIGSHPGFAFREHTASRTGTAG